MRFSMLGPLEVADDRGPIPVGGPKQRALIALLLVHRGEAVPSDVLIEELWSGRPPATAAKTLQAHVSHLRRTLGAGTVTTCGHGYRLAVAPGDVDVDVFEALAADGRAELAAGDPEAAARTLRRALTLWRGPPLADLEGADFARDERARLEEVLLEAAEERIDAELAAGHHAAVVAEAETLARAHPLREGLHCRLMLALYRCGRQAEALAAYHRIRRGLGDELGIEPGRALRDLQRAILEQDDALAAASTPMAVARRRPALALIALGGAIVAAAAGSAALVGDRTDRGGTVVAEPATVAARSAAVVDRVSGRLVGAVPLPASPTRLAAAGGSVWAALPERRAIARIDPERRRVVRLVGVRSRATAVAAGAGAVWAAGGPSRAVWRIDPQRDRVAVAVPTGVRASAIAADGDALWVASRLDRAIVRLDGRTGAVRLRAAMRLEPAAVAAGAGAVWVADRSSNAVARLDPRTGAPARTFRVGAGPAGLALAAGSPWVAERLDGTLSRIDARTGARTTLAVVAAPDQIAVDGDELWVTGGGDGAIAGIDLRRGRTIAIVALGRRPCGVAVQGRRVVVGVC